MQRVASWMIIVPAVHSEVRPALDAFRAQHDLHDVERWSITAVGEHSTITSDEPGAEGSHDLELARQLSTRFAGPVGLIWPKSDGVFAFVDGQDVAPGTRAALWRSLARPAPPEATAPDEVVLVLLGARPEELAEVVPSGGPLSVSAGPSGAIVRHASGMAGALAPMLSARVTGTVVAVCAHPFWLVTYDKGDVTGAMGARTPATEGAPPLASIAGASEPAPVLAALGLERRVERSG